MIRASASSDAGRLRDQNEDRFLVDAVRGVFAVIDGVGGHAGGERAAAIALDQLTTRLGRDAGRPAERVREAIALANNAIFDTARHEPALDGMTCVLTVAIVDDDHLTIGHVGDSRLYLVTESDIRKLTRDHSPVGEREDAGDISEAEAMHHPRRNEVYRDVGSRHRTPDEPDFIDVVETTLPPRATLILCSDGLSDLVPASAIGDVARRHAGDATAAVAALIRAANDAGGKDNITVVLVEHLADVARTRQGPADHGRSDARHAAAWFGAGVATAAMLLSAALWFWPARPAPAPTAAPVETAAPRTWRVGLTSDADTSTITEAVTRAVDGDRLVLAAGDYRESIVLSKSLTLEGTRDVHLRAPIGAREGFTAITVTNNADVRIAGIAITGAPDAPIFTGVRLASGTLELDDVAVAGVAGVGVDAGPSTRLHINACDIVDSTGPGVRVGDLAALDIARSRVMRNGRVTGQTAAGVVVASNATVRVEGNAIGSNGGPAIAGLDRARLTQAVRDNLLQPSPDLTSPRRRAARPPS